MRVGRLKRPEARFDTAYLGSLNIKMYGKENLYPQEMRDIVFASPAGRLCFERKAAYIEGNGLVSRALSEAMCNACGDMVDDIHSQLCRDLALYDGFALHVNYNILGEITSMAAVPFEDCRLEEDDDAGDTAHIAVHPDWTGRRLTRNGRQVQVNRRTVVYFPVFNPDPAVVQAQITAAGGIDLYRGQVLYMTTAGRNRYAVPPHDAAATDMSADEGISNVGYRNVRNSFLPSAVLWMRKGASWPQAVEGDRTGNSNPDPDDEFFDNIAALQGDVNAGKLLVIMTDTEEEKPEVVPLSAENYDRQFEVTRKAGEENIYAAFGQEMFYRLRSGSLGFSGEVADDAKSEYCEFVTRYQRLLKRTYVTVFGRWSAKEPLPYLSPEDAEVEPLLRSVDPSASAEEPL